MGLSEVAAADLRAILEDDVGGFGVAITVTSPDGVSAVINGFTTRITEEIDPETGIAVTGTKAHALLHVDSLAAAGLGVPKGVADGSIKPWRIAFADATGATRVYKVQASMPDDKFGLVRCILEAYKPAA